MGKDNPEKSAVEPKPHPHAFTSVELAQQIQEHQKMGSLAQATLVKITPLTDAEQRMPIRMAQALPPPVKDNSPGAHSVAPGQPAAPQSILDFAVHKALDPVVGVFTNDQQYKVAAADGVKEVLKTAPLFMAGKVAGLGTMVAYATDEVKTSDRGLDLVTDAGLGLAKGGTLRLAQNQLLTRGHSPSLMGVELGVVNRATSVGFTKQNYYDQDGKFNVGLGLARSGLAAVESIGTDALIYGGADVVWGRAFARSRGEATFNPVITTGITAGAFNMTTAAGAEVTRQIDNGKFEPGTLASRSLTAGFIGLGAGTLAGLQRRNFLSLGINDGPNALKEARSTPFQLGRIVDEAQAPLRDGTFVPERRIPGFGPTGDTWVGKVVHANGETPAIFRVNDGSEAFAHRMQSEIAGYGLNKEIGFKNPFPTTVARNVELEGQQVTGFIQEMRGTDLVSYFEKQGVEKTGQQLDRKQLIRNLNDNLDLKNSLAESWTERMTYGEWDNHALNQVVARTANGDVAANIDLGDGFRAAKTQLDLVPTPGLRRSYENSNSYIYKELAGKPLDPDVVAKMQSFVDRNNSDAGRQKIQALGLTPQQTEGVLGRSQWFASNQVLPSSTETPGYRAVSKIVKPVLKPVKDGLRYVKSALKSALQQ